MFRVYAIVKEIDVGQGKPSSSSSNAGLSETICRAGVDRRPQQRLSAAATRASGARRPTDDDDDDDDTGDRQRRGGRVVFTSRGPGPIEIRLANATVVTGGVSTSSSSTSKATSAGNKGSDVAALKHSNGTTSADYVVIVFEGKLYSVDRQ